MGHDQKPSDTGSGDEPIRVDSSTTPLQHLSSDPPLSVTPEDLTGDVLLSTFPRVEFGGRTVPRLGEIPLLKKLGHGGMGAVYLAVYLILILKSSAVGARFRFVLP